MPPFRALAVLALLLAGSGHASLPAQSSQAGRPVVLVVHGRGQLGRDTADVRREALDALRRGAFAVSGDSLIGDGDVRLIWYADVLDRPRGAVCDSPEANALSAGESPLNALTIIAALAGAIFDAAEPQVSGEGGDEVRGIRADLRYLADRTTRCSAERRVAAAIERASREGRPVILVAHSLGALVSWGHLRQRAQLGGSVPAVERFITVGSPLGSAEIRELVFGDVRAPLALPRAVGSWVNVVDADDPFAIRLATDTASVGSSIVDLVTEQRAEETHKLAGYLRDPAGARAVLSAWCGAYSAVPARVWGACRKLSGVDRTK